MGQAVREAYSDLFTITARPTEADRELIEGKFRSAFNATPITSKLMASTFYALLSLADVSEVGEAEAKKKETEQQLKATIPPSVETIPQKGAMVNRMLLPSEFQRVYMYIADWNRAVGL